MSRRQMYLIGEVAWLLAEQAHRYQEDLSRLGDERDALVAQHDQDAETIGKLQRDIGRLQREGERDDRALGAAGERHIALKKQRDEARSLVERIERDRDSVLGDLSAEFASWMMMLPAGHVTDPAIGLSRNEQLKAIGNGVVPPQAFAALSMLVPVAESLGVA